MSDEQTNIGDHVFHIIGTTGDDGSTVKKVICSRVTGIHRREREDLPGRVSETRFELRAVESGLTYVGEEPLFGASKCDAVEKAISYEMKALASLTQLLDEMRTQEEPVEGKTDE